MKELVLRGKVKKVLFLVQVRSLEQIDTKLQDTEKRKSLDKLENGKYTKKVCGHKAYEKAKLPPPPLATTDTKQMVSPNFYGDFVLKLSSKTALSEYKIVEIRNLFQFFSHGKVSESMLQNFV